MRDDRLMYSSGKERIIEDFYPTPTWCTQLLLKHFRPEGNIWEPACGALHISSVLEENGYTVYNSDITNRTSSALVKELDFINNQVSNAIVYAGQIKSIITNPPYFADMPEYFIIKSLELMGPVNGSVCMFLRNEYDCAKGRTHLFQHPAFHMKIVATKRPRWIEGSEGSPRHNYAWYVWDFNTLGNEPTIRYGQ